MVEIGRRRLLLSVALSVVGLRSGVVAAAPETAATVPSLLLDAHARSASTVEARASLLTYGQADEPLVLRVAKGAAIRLRLKNRLAEPTNLDWHGMRLPGAAEVAPGLTGWPVKPGADAEISITPPDSGTYWFHPSAVPGWSNQAGRGLAGVLVVEEPHPPDVDDDRVLMLTDRLDASGTAAQDNLVVNGKAWPARALFRPGARIRLRLVNGSTGLALAAAFTGARPAVIAIDGQPSELFQPLNDRLPIGPGARFDVLVDLPRDAEAEFKLVLLGPGQALGANLPPVFIARTKGEMVPNRPPIAALTPNPSLPRIIPLDGAKRVDILVRNNADAKPGQRASFSINGVHGEGLPKAPLFTVKRNTTVTLGLNNKSSELVALRPHGHVMRLLHALDDGWEPYWRDSILVPPGKNLHAAFLADNPGRWLIESPFFDQTVAGLRGWFEVT